MRKILLVEDDSVIREAFTLILTLNSYDVTSAENGRVAVDLCNQHTYDLILLDVMMPVLDGIGFLKEYTANHPDAITKIIIMSNLSSGSELSMIQDFGVERAVLKSSLTPTKLLSIVTEVIPNDEQ